MSDLTRNRDIAVSEATPEADIWSRLTDAINSEMKVSCGPPSNGAAKFRFGIYDIEVNVRKVATSAKVAFFAQQKMTGVALFMLILNIVLTIVIPAVGLFFGIIGIVIALVLVVWNWIGYGKLFKLARQKTESSMDAVLTRLEMTLK